MKFHFDSMHANFNGHSSLIYSYTGYLVDKIIHPGVYDLINQSKQHFDLSDSKRHGIDDAAHLKSLVKFKDEMQGLFMTEFIALSPSVYSINNLSLD